MPNCCEATNKPKGLKQGLLSGLIPHTFCLIFIIGSIIGATGTATLAKKFLLIPHFFLFLILISFLFTGLSAWIYLKKNKCCTVAQGKSRRNYLIILTTTAIATNLLIIFVIFPILTNIQPARALSQETQVATGKIIVEIPCSGHAPLIIDDLSQDAGVATVKFTAPNIFNITYEPGKTSLEKIVARDIFKSFKAQIIN